MSAELDHIVSAFDRMSRIAHLRDLVRDAADANRPRCGSCFYWMMSRHCPREKNLGGMTRGPSCEASPCQKYRRTQSSIDIAKNRLAVAIAFATDNGLPVPPAFTPPSTEGDGR